MSLKYIVNKHTSIMVLFDGKLELPVGGVSQPIEESLIAEDINLGTLISNGWIQLSDTPVASTSVKVELEFENSKPLGSIEPPKPKEETASPAVVLEPLVAKPSKGARKNKGESADTGNWS